MTILGICFDSTSTGVMHHHDVGLAILSFVIAAIASFCSLDMAERMRATDGRTRIFWLLMAGITLGKDYPHPLLAHDEARKRTLERYAVVKK